MTRKVGAAEDSLNDEEEDEETGKGDRSLGQSPGCL